MTTNKEKIGIWISLFLGILGLFGVQVPKEITPILDAAVEASKGEYKVDLDVVSVD